MRRVFFFMTVALVSVLSIDVSKRGKHSKADQKKLRGTKVPPAFDRNNCITMCTEKGILPCGFGRNHVDAKDGTKWCCAPECEAGTGLLVEGPDGLNYCCKQDIQMDASRLTHKRTFEDVDLAQTVVAVGAATKTVDLLESAYYSKSNTIAGLEAGLNLQKELQQEAEAAQKAQAGRIESEKAALANEEQTLEAKEARLTAVKQGVDTKVKNLEFEKQTLEEQKRQQVLKLDEEEETATELSRSIAAKRLQIETMKTRQDQRLNSLSNGLQTLHEEIAAYERESRDLGDQLAAANEFTKKCLDAQKVQANQKKAADATAQMGEEQMEMIAGDLDKQQATVKAQMDLIQQKRKLFDDKIKEMQANADMNQHADFKKLQDKMAAEIAKIDEANKKLGEQVKTMDKQRDNVNAMVDKLNLMDNSVGALGEDDSPVTVRFRAMEKKIQDKIKAMEDKCDRGSTAEVAKIVINANSIKGCTDTENCQSWKGNLDITFKGIRNLATCMKAEYDELCGLMTEYKTQQTTLSTELEASRKITVETVAKTRKALADFEIEQKAARKRAEASDARIVAIEGLTDAAKNRFEKTKEWVGELNEALKALGIQIQAIEATIQQYDTELVQAEQDYQQADAQYKKLAKDLEANVRDAEVQSKDIHMQVAQLRQEVRDAGVRKMAALKALGDNVDCNTLAAMDCVKITEKAKCQAKDVAKHCVWQDSDDEMSGGKKDTCRWIDEDSATAIMTTKLFSEDYQDAFYGLIGDAEELESQGGGVTSKLDELMGTLNEFKIPPAAVIPLGVEICNLVKGQKAGGCQKETDGRFTFEGADLVVFDKNNFGCQEKSVCKTKDETGGGCVPEGHISHGHYKIDGNPVAKDRKLQMATHFSCRQYSFDRKTRARLYDVWAKSQVDAAKSEAGTSIPSWITQENAGCLNFEALKHGVKAVQSMASVLHTIHAQRNAMYCKIKGIFVREGATEPFCEGEGPCWHKTAGQCRANYVLDLAMEYLQNDELYSVPASEIPGYRSKVCVEPPTEYSNDASVKIECGPNVCVGLIESAGQSTVTAPALGSSSPKKVAPPQQTQSWSNVVQTGKATGIPQSPGKMVNNGKKAA